MEERELLDGKIFKSIMKMSLPLMGTAFIQMCYSLVDLMWLGRLSTDAVAAVGCCSFFIWIAQAVTLIAKTGLSVGLAQNYGSGNRDELKKVMVSGFWVNIFFWLLLTGIYLIFNESILGFYNLSEEVFKLSKIYFIIISIGLIFTFINPMLSATFFSRGDSVAPFKISIVGLVFNIVFDPILIFGMGPFPKMGIAGAAIATVLAQGIISLLFIYIGIKNHEIFTKVNYFNFPNKKYFIEHLRLGVPASLQSSIHATVGIVLNRFIAIYGARAIAVYSIGSQIESITWMSADGFAVAFSAFFAQNYGAKNFDRLKDGRRECLKIILAIGLSTTFLLFFFAKELFTIFIPKDREVILMGINYLRIIGLSQFFMILEIGTTGMLNGLGLTKYPAINAIILNILRIPFVVFLIPYFAVNGIWMSMTMSSILKGISVSIIYIYLRNKTRGFKIDMEKYL